MWWYLLTVGRLPLHRWLLFLMLALAAAVRPGLLEPDGGDVVDGPNFMVWVQNQQECAAVGGEEWYVWDDEKKLCVCTYSACKIPLCKPEGRWAYTHYLEHTPAMHAGRPSMQELRAAARAPIADTGGDGTLEDGSRVKDERLKNMMVDIFIYLRLALNDQEVVDVIQNALQNTLGDAAAYQKSIFANMLPIMDQTLKFAGNWAIPEDTWRAFNVLLEQICMDGPMCDAASFTAWCEAPAPNPSFAHDVASRLAAAAASNRFARTAADAFRYGVKRAEAWAPAWTIGVTQPIESP